MSDPYSDDSFGSIIPAPVNVPQSPSPPPIAGVAPDPFKQTQCDAGIISNLGEANKVAQEEGLTNSSSNSLLSNPAATNMACSMGIINSEIGRSSNPGVSTSAQQQAGSGSSNSGQLVGSILGGAAKLGLQSVGGVSGLYCKVTGLFSSPAWGLGGSISSTYGCSLLEGEDGLSSFGDETGDLGLSGDLSSLYGCADLIGDIGGDGIGELSGLASEGISCAVGVASSEFSCEIGDAASYALSIICTELFKQNRLAKHWYKASALEFHKYCDTAKRGYYVLAAPFVNSLRSNPNSLLSKIIAKLMNLQAEDAAAKHNLRGAKRHRIVKGLMTATIWPTCFILGKLTASKNPAFSIGGTLA